MYPRNSQQQIYRHDSIMCLLERELIDGSTHLAKDCQPVKFLFAYFEKIDLWGNVT